MKLKNANDISKILFNKTIKDLEHDTDDFTASEYLFFVKDTSYDNDLNNKLSLIIVDKETGYVVNNDFKFKALKIKEKEITIYSYMGNKAIKIYYWLK